MVIGTGGLIHQVIARDKYPEALVDDTKTIKFKIHNPAKPNHFRKKTGLQLGNLGGNWDDQPNPARKFFGRRTPVVEDPDGISGKIKSPQEIEIEVDEDEEDVEADVDSDLDSGVAMGRASDTGEEEDDEEVSPEEEREQFAALFSEARNQPRELEPAKEKRKMKMKRKENKKDERQPPPGVMQIMVVKRAGPVNARVRRSSRWRTFLEAMRRVLSPGQW